MTKRDIPSTGGSEKDSDKVNRDDLGQTSPDKRPSDGTIGDEKGETNSGTQNDGPKNAG